MTGRLQVYARSNVRLRTGFAYVWRVDVSDPIPFVVYGPRFHEKPKDAKREGKAVAEAAGIDIEGAGR